MENDSRSPGPDPAPADDEAPSAAGARDALGRLDSDGARLAQRVVTPWWYHPALGAIVALVIGAQALPGISAAVVAALAVIALPFLVTAYTKRYGVAVSGPLGPRTRRVLVVLLVLLALTLLSALAVKLTGSPAGWALIPAAVAFLVTLVLGRRYDEALRAELSRPSGHPA